MLNLIQKKVGLTILSFLSINAVLLSYEHDQECGVWKKTHYISYSAIIGSCDKGLSRNPSYFFRESFPFDEKNYRNIKQGDIVWVRCNHLPRFIREVLPRVKSPFVLVIAKGDRSFPSESRLNTDEIQFLIHHKNIIHIFAQNYEGTFGRGKVTHLPVGIKFELKNQKGDTEEILEECFKRSLPTYKRIKKAFVDFQHNNTSSHGRYNRYLQFGEDRKTIFSRLLKTSLIDYSDKIIPRCDLWRKKSGYAFSISPPGNGLDCYRTWEDLALGCIVIVKTSPLDPMYKGLPVVIVNDWSEITEENLEKWLVQYGDASTNPRYREKITFRYWWDKIQKASSLCKNGRTRQKKLGKK